MQVFNVGLRLKAVVRMSGMVRQFRSLGALVLTIVAGLAAAQGIPSLGGYDRETRQSMELACVSEKVNGPVAYGVCLNRQIASMQNSPGIPSLDGYDRETRQSMELACVSEKVNGPVAYGACLNRQIASMQNSPGIPSLGGYDRETRQSMELACVSEKVNGPVAYGACLNRQIASPQDSHGTISSQSPSQTSESQPQRASKRSSQSSSQVNATRPQTAPARPAKSAPAVGTTLWYEAIPFVILLVALSVYLTPTIWVLASSRSRGGAKFGWFIVSLCFSWLGLAAFLIFTQASRNRPNT
jgi:hypothetical protein